MSQLIARLRPGYARPTPGRFLVAALGLVVVLIPAASPYGNVRFIALAGVVLALSTVVLWFAGVATTICGFGIVETAIVTVHEGGFVLAVAEAVVLLAYLQAVDIAPEGGELRSHRSDLGVELGSTFAGGLALVAVIAAFSLVTTSGSFAVAILGVVAAALVVAVLRWMLSHG
jgi:hypothetical protein